MWTAPLEHMIFFWKHIHKESIKILKSIKLYRNNTLAQWFLLISCFSFVHCERTIFSDMRELSLILFN